MLMRLYSPILKSLRCHSFVIAITATLLVALSALPDTVNAHLHPAAVLEVSLSESNYQADDLVSGEVRVTVHEKFVGRLRLVVIDEATGLRIYRRVFHLRLHRATTESIGFTIVPTPPASGSYKVVATLIRDDSVRIARATGEFSVLAASPVTPLPFWLSYCLDPTCGGREPLVVRVCPTESPSCSPSRQTTVIPRVDGRQISQIRFPIQTLDGSRIIATAVSGSGVITSLSSVLSFTSPVVLKSDIEVTLSFYDVAPTWDGTTNLDFVSETMISDEATTIVYRHPTFLVNDEATQLHERSREIIAGESQIAGINPGQMRAFFMPTELVTFGEGNFSDGNLNVFMNYSNPPFIRAKGSIYDVVMPRFAHEYVHELFSEVAQSHPGNNICLNEGLADAFAFAAGFLPESDFGPVALRGGDFNQGCAEITQNFEIHDAGNCPFWQVHRMGLLSQSFVVGVLRPQRALAFDSCNLTSVHTGNAFIVLFSEAAGIDMTEAIDMAEIPNAGSLEAAKQALGL
jgi:hypothetical protein